MDGLMDGKKRKYSVHIQIKVYDGILRATNNNNNNKKL